MQRKNNKKVNDYPLIYFNFAPGEGQPNQKSDKIIFANQKRSAMNKTGTFSE
jgi:hypothetical protein